MAFSYYRRTSGHERDTILRQGTEADLTSGQIYGRTNALSVVLASKSRPTPKGPIQRTPIMITMIAIIREIDGRTHVYTHLRRVLVPVRRNDDSRDVCILRELRRG